MSEEQEKPEPFDVDAALEEAQAEYEREAGKATRERREARAPDDDEKRERAEPAERDDDEDKEARRREKLEKQARKYGWRPKDEWKGDTSGWTDAERFMELPATQVKILREEQEKRDKKFADDLKRQEEQSRKMVMALARQQKAEFDKRLNAARQAQQRAVESGDVDAYKRARAAEDNLRKHAAQQQRPRGPDPAERQRQLDALKSEFSWIDDPLMVDEARRIIDAGLKAKRIQTNDAKDQVAFADGELKRRYPHMFGDQSGARSNGVSKVDGGGMGVSKRGKGWSDLPADVRRVAQELLDQGLVESKEGYAKEYFALNER